MRDEDVVFVKGVVEASEGLGAVFSERGGDLVIAVPPEREREMDEVLRDLARELEGALLEPQTRGDGDGPL